MELLAREGDTVDKGQPLLRLHSDDPNRFGPAVQAIAPGVVIAPEPTDATARPLVIDRIRA